MNNNNIDDIAERLIEQNRNSGTEKNNILNEKYTKLIFFKIVN